MHSHKVQYPEPEEIIGEDNLKDYIQWWLAIQEYSAGEGTALKNIDKEKKSQCREIQNRLQTYGYYLDRISWEYGKDTKKAVPHWNICAWSEKGLLRPGMLKPNIDGTEDYHKTNWKLYAAPELLHHVNPPLDALEIKKITDSDNPKNKLPKEEVKKLVESICKSM